MTLVDCGLSSGLVVTTELRQPERLALGAFLCLSPVSPKRCVCESHVNEYVRTTAVEVLFLRPRALGSLGKLLFLSGVGGDAT